MKICVLINTCVCIQHIHMVHTFPHIVPVEDDDNNNDEYSSSFISTDATEQVDEQILFEEIKEEEEKETEFIRLISRSQW